MVLILYSCAGRVALSSQLLRRERHLLVGVQRSWVSIF
jgi:hypothetical protein